MERFAALFVLVAVVGTFVLLRWAQRYRIEEAWRCPGCHRSGMASASGRVVCTTCQKEFILDYRGRPVNTLAVAAVPQVLLLLLPAGLLAYRLITVWSWWTTLLLAFVLGLGSQQIIKVCRRKQFVTE
jgi:hypothetical protein